MHRASLYILLFAVALLSAFGIVMLASTGYYLEEGEKQTYATMNNQATWLGLAVVVAAVVAFLNPEKLYEYRWWIFGVALVGLVMCYVPFFAKEINGARRWVSLHSLGLDRPSFQPSEVAKLAIIIVLAGWFARYEPLTREFVGGFVKPGCLLVATVLLIAGEVDLGTAALVTAVGVSLMYVAGTRWYYLAAVVVAAGGALGLAIRLTPNRVARIMAFLDLEKYKDEIGLQQWRALMALGSGAYEGVGAGDGRLKRGFLPESETDFIFPNVGEEHGLYGTLLIVGLFVAVSVAGMIIAHRAPTRFMRLVAVGITVTLALEALINMGVTTALLPNKGLPLPFVSYGGTNLLFAMISVGILVAIHRKSFRTVTRKDLLDTRRGGMRAATHGAHSL